MVNKNDIFWSVYEGKDKKKKISLNLDKYLKWIQSKGFYRKDSDDGNYILVRIVDNVVTEVYKQDVRFFILSFLRSLPWEIEEQGIYSSQLIDWYGDNHSKMTSDPILDLLESKRIDFYRDDMTNARVFFENGVVSITKDSITTGLYSKFKGVIWKQQIVGRKIKIQDGEGKSMFEKFLSNIFGGSVTNLKSVRTAIGYLLHNYKPTSYAPAIVLNDKELTGNPDGGTGKGIVAKAIGHFRNGIILDGKSFDFNKTFAFQRVELFTDMIVFDDVKQSFNFEKLFSVITEGITVEKKNKGEFFIPFEHSPKIMITTNYALKGEGNSIERRKVDFELEDYYSKDFTPYDEFGKMFFSEWDEKEWLLFDNFMIKCLQMYLQNGIIMPKNVNIAEKRLISNTSEAFVEFMEDFNEFGIAKVKSAFAVEIRHAIGLDYMKSNTITKWIKSYCTHKNLEIRDGKNQFGRTVKIGYTKEEEAEILIKKEEQRQLKLELEGNVNK